MYKSVTLLFPGQGTQYIGMGSRVKNEEFFNAILQADDVLGYPLSKMMLEGPESDLVLTQNTQPAIVTYSAALFYKLEKLLLSKNIKIDRVLGHSVGEYSALVAAKVLSLSDATKAVHLRGKFMQEAVPFGKGKMFAIMKVPMELIVNACQEVSTPDAKVMPANFNEPEQTVISGDAEAAQKAIKWIESNFESRFRAMELNVSAPFHSSLMEPAALNLKTAFEKITFNSSAIPYVANVDAKEYPSQTLGETVKENLVKQVCGSVLWTQSIRTLSSNTLCIEVGPGKVLQGLVKKINPEIKVISLDNDTGFSDLEGVLG